MFKVRSARYPVTVGMAVIVRSDIVSRRPNFKTMAQAESPDFMVETSTG